MPPLDRCDTSFGNTNKSVIDNPLYKASLKYAKTSKNISSQHDNLFGTIEPPAKYGVNQFPSLADFKCELKGRFDAVKIIPTDNDQLMPERNLIPCIHNHTNSSIKMKHVFTLLNKVRLTYQM